MSKIIKIAALTLALGCGSAFAASESSDSYNQIGVPLGAQQTNDGAGIDTMNTASVPATSMDAGARWDRMTVDEQNEATRVCRTTAERLNGVCDFIQTRK